MELVVLSFAGGAVVAALVFWPLLRRVRKHADGPPTGRHALRTHRSTAPPAGAPTTGVISPPPDALGATANPIVRAPSPGGTPRSAATYTWGGSRRRGGSAGG
ncbi:hypothetical protein LCD33_22460, partial [Saccharopolyspora sp. 7B]|nr:hypothetical protein [Saccharopolyspora sp. 7B]